MFFNTVKVFFVFFFSETDKLTVSEYRNKSANS